MTWCFFHRKLQTTLRSGSRADLEQRLDVKPSKQALSFILQPLQHLSVSVTYNASEPGEHQSMFFVRNNLTVVEVVTVSGMAVHLDFTLDGIHPLVTQEQYENVSLAKPIVFDLKPNYLAEHCNGTSCFFKGLRDVLPKDPCSHTRYFLLYLGFLSIA